jgi:hypothetical protein
LHSKECFCVASVEQLLAKLTKFFTEMSSNLPQDCNVVSMLDFTDSVVIKRVTQTTDCGNFISGVELIA